MNLLTLAIFMMIVCFISPAVYVGGIYYDADISSRNNALLHNCSIVQLHDHAIARMFRTSVLFYICSTTVLIVKIVNIRTSVLFDLRRTGVRVERIRTNVLCPAL